MVVGENSRSGRHGRQRHQGEEAHQRPPVDGEELVRLIPHRALSLEQALEFCREDECVEVTPAAVRIRKVVLDAKERERTRAAPSAPERPALPGGFVASAARRHMHRSDGRRHQPTTVSLCLDSATPGRTAINGGSWGAVGTAYSGETGVRA